eukprot:Em0008g89a
MEPVKSTSSYYILIGKQVTTLRSLQANRSYAGYDPAKPSSKPVVCRLRPCEAFKQTGRKQVMTLRSLQANRSYAGYDPAKPSSKPVVPLKMEPAKTTSSNHLRNGKQVTTLRSLQTNRSYAGYDPAKPSSKSVVPAKTTSSNHLHNGLISSQDKVESFARNLASVQGVGRHSLDSAKICSKSFFKYAGSIDVVWTLRSLQANRSYAGYDPAKPSSKSVVSRLRPCETFKQTGRTCENYFQQPFTQWQAGYDPAKPSSKPVVSRLRPCEAFKQTGRKQATTLRSLQANRSYAGSIEDGTCENYFQQPLRNGLISSQDKVESFASNIASVQGVGRHSLDSAKICSKSFFKFGELPISL